MDGLEESLQNVTAGLASLGEKMERLAELTVAMQQTCTSTAAAVEVRICLRLTALQVEMCIHLCCAVVVVLH